MAKAAQGEQESSKVNLSFVVSTAIGRTFYRLGFYVSSHPWRTICFAWFVVAVCSMGLFCFYNERDPMKLWVPEGSPFAKDTEWLTSRFEEGTRVQSVLITAPDVLTPEVLKKALRIHDSIFRFTIKESNGSVFSLEDLCFKIPIIGGFANFQKRRRRSHTTDSDQNQLESRKNLTKSSPKRPFAPSVDLEPDFFCGIVESLPLGCMQENILELWKFDDRKLGKLSKEEIISALNSTKISPYSGHEMEYEHLLGGVTRDENGRIVAATSLIAHYMLHMNFSESDTDKIGNMAGTEDWASESNMKWEGRFIKTMQKMKREIELEDGNVTVYFSAGRSYGDISNSAMFDDMDKLAIGIILMFLYMQLVLSRCGWTEIRFALGSLGLLCVGMAFVSGCGICSFLGISYGPVHTSLPFLLMGLGVDDIFVMMACWRKVQSTHPQKTPQEQMGLMLQHAGASITVTSVTDIVAFFCGAITILPSLQSFCLYAAVSVFMTYFFVVTFFVAIFALDERRIAQRRNAFIPFLIHSDEESKVCVERNLTSAFLQGFYSKFVLTKPGKIIVIMTVIGMTALNTHSLLDLRQKFDPSWFIPSNTYLGQYLSKSRELYPDLGAEASVLIGRINYTQDMQKIIDLHREIELQTDILHDTKGWPGPFASFVRTHHEKDIQNLTDTELRQYLSQFLYSNQGGKFQSHFRFERKLKCGEPTPNITVSQITFKFKKMSEREDYLPAKAKMEEIVREAHLDSGEGFSTVWARIFGNHVTDSVIDKEIYRNIALAMVGVMACTALVIVNLQVCFWIFATVVLTLINVGGTMQRVGLTLDIVSCISLQLSVGLCVDYAAHIGHTFLTINQGTRNERALNTVLHIGAAICAAGFSTWLALVVLANSQAYTYRSFFKIFSLVIAYGLFHGIVLLPVILSLVGPGPYDRSQIKSSVPAKATEMETLSFIQSPAVVNQNGALLKPEKAPE